MFFWDTVRGRSRSLWMTHDVTVFDWFPTRRYVYCLQDTYWETGIVYTAPACHVPSPLGLHNVMYLKLEEEWY